MIIQQPFSLMTGALFLVLTMMLSLAVATTVHAEPDAITAKPLTQRHAFGGNVSVQITQELDGLPAQVVDIEDASKVAVVEFTIQPGAVFPWHTHPGTVLINITEGDFVFVFGEDCVERRYGPGMALVDPGHTVHTAFNPGREEATVVIATLIGVPAEGPLMTQVDAQEGAALDEKCGIKRADAGNLLSGY